MLKGIVGLIFIGGIVGDGSVNYSYNTADINCADVDNGRDNKYIGGIAGSGGVGNSFNTGNISYTNNECEEALVNFGGITGSGDVQDSYNTGNISNTIKNAQSVWVAGITGRGTTTNSYNTGNIYNNVESCSDIHTNSICSDSSTNTYYPSNINIIGKNTYKQTTPPTELSEDKMKTEEFYNILHQNSPEAPWKYIPGTYPILDIATIAELQKQTEIEVKNEKAELDITAEIIENLSGEKTGGTITTKNKVEDDRFKYSDTIFVEKLAYKGTSTNSVTITPSEGYQISKVIINGNLVELDYDSEGKAVISEGYFKDVTQNYNVQVSFDEISKIVTVKKVDENNTPLAGAEFSIEEIDEREEVTNAIGELVNKDVESYIIDKTKPVENTLGDIKNVDSTYYFVKQEDGSYVSNNTRRGTTSHSSIKIDLSDKSEDTYYKIITNAEVKSSGKNDNVNVFINKNETDTGATISIMQEYTNTNLSAKDYTTFSALKGGEVYYLHFQYRVSSLIDSDDYECNLKINNIKVYEATKQIYNFEKINNTYKPQNLATNMSGATSVIPIDLTNATGKCDISFNVNLECDEQDSTYVGISTSETSVGTGIFTEKGSISNKPYKTTVVGGKVYYLIMRYGNGTNSNYAEDNTIDNFTIEDLKVSLNKDDYLSKTVITTNNDGIAVFPCKYGKYNIIEESAPEGYSKSNEVYTIEVGDNTNNTLTVTNKKQRKVIAHYYRNGTGPEFGNDPVVIKDDEVLYGNEGTEYKTVPYITIGGYELIKDKEGNYIVPENASGKYTEDEINVYYYYEGSYRIKTSVLKHTEKHKDGSVTQEVTGGHISGEGMEFYEEVQLNGSNKLEIKMTPDEGYKIVAIKINGKRINYRNVFNEDGSVTLNPGYFENVTENKNIQVEYRKISSVTSKYYDKETRQPIVEDVKTDGHESKAFETEQKILEHYEFDSITDENGNEITIPEEMYAEDLVVIYWYNKVKTGVIERHIGIDKDGKTEELETKTTTSTHGKEVTIPRKQFTGYEPADGPESTKDGVIVMKKDENSKTITVEDNKNVEVWYYYTKKKSTVTVKYIDIRTEKEIIQSETLQGAFGEEYETQRKEIEGYTLNTSKLPNNEKGTYTENEIVVTYYYDKNIKEQTYKIEVIYMANNEAKDGAKIKVQDADGVIKSDYVKDGRLYVGEFKANEEGTVQYVITEEETPKFCTTILSNTKPGILEVSKKINYDNAIYDISIKNNNINGFTAELNNNTNTITVYIKTDCLEKYDLSMKKFISSIDGNKTTNREPVATIKEDGKIEYTVNDKIEEAANNQKVIYTLRMYNESAEVNAKGKRIIEYIPDGLVFVPDDDANAEYKWRMYSVDEKGKPTRTQNAEEADIIVTDYLRDKEIQKVDTENAKVYYSEVKALFRVDETKITSKDRIIENKVQIVPNENDDNTDNDISTEKLYVKYFDLDITKYIKTVVIKDNKDQKVIDVGESRKGEIVKIDVNKNTAKNTKIIVTYGLKVKNIGEIPGYATKIVDYIPENFELVDENWKVEGKNAITTSIEDVLIQPGESKDIEVTFEWDLSRGTVGSRINEAKILEYKNDYDAKDPTDDNNDSEEMIVAIRTGRKIYAVVIYLFIAFASFTGLCIYIKD